MPNRDTLVEASGERNARAVVQALVAYAMSMLEGL